MFEFVIALACGIVLGLVVYSVIFLIGSFMVMTSPKIVKWAIKVIVDRCKKITEELSAMTEEE